MLLGPFLAVQTPLACGLATVPSSGKLSPVSQLRLVFERGWSCPCMSFWPWRAGYYIQGLLLNLASRSTNRSLWAKSRWEDTEATPVSKNTTKGNRFQYCKDNSLHIHHCTLGLREELNFLSHSFSHPSNSFSPPPAPQVYISPQLHQWLKPEGGREGSEISLAFDRGYVCVQMCTEHAWVLWWISRNAQCNNPAGCDLAGATAVIGWLFYLLLQSPHASALCPCHRVWILAQQLLMAPAFWLSSSLMRNRVVGRFLWRGW